MDNRKSSRIYSNKLPTPIFVKCLAGHLGDHLIDPIILPNRLSGAAYLNFLMYTLPQFLKNMPLAKRLSMWYMHDGAPAHFMRNVREYLNTVFGQRWIGRSGPVAWPLDPLI